MPQPLPHRYELLYSAEADGRGHASAGARPEIHAGPPPEFDGRADDWSPEHLLLSALAACFVATFTALARKHKFAPRAFALTLSGVLDRTSEGLRFTGLELRPKLVVPFGSEKQALELLQLTEKHCPVHQALKVPIALRPDLISG